MSSDYYNTTPGFRSHKVDRPGERKKKPQECSRCHVLYDGPTEHLIRNLYLHGWRVVFSDDGPTHMLCPECYRLHERNSRVTAK